MDSKAQIVVAFDNSSGAADALALASWLARSTGNPLLVVAVYPKEAVPVLPGIGSDWLKEVKDTATDALTTARRLLGDQPADFRSVGATSSARGLDSVAERVNAAMIVVGSSGHGPGRRVRNNHTANRLFHGASAPVLIAPRGTRDQVLPPASHIGCAFLPSKEGRSALRHAAGIARASGAQLDVFTVVAHAAETQLADPQAEKAYLKQARGTFAEELDKAVASVRGSVDAAAHLLEGDPVDALAALDERDCQLLVCGSRGYGPVRRVLLGGVSERLVRRAACPVMVVPRGAR